MEAQNLSLEERFARLFQGYSGSYGTFEIFPNQTAVKQQGIAKTISGPLYVTNYVEHLAGRIGLGIIPLLSDNENARFGCIDIDIYTIDHKKLEKDCRNLPVVMTKSKSGGAHLWLFTKEPVSARLIQDNLKAWAALLGFGKSEIFPKQIKRIGVDDVGNWINLPYFGNTKKGFLNGKDVDLEAFLTAAEERSMNAETLEDLLGKINNQPLFHDGPPCLATITKKGIMPGTRNIVMLNVGSYFKKKNPVDFQEQILQFNKKYLSDPLSETEIQTSVVKSLQRRTYPYQCNQEPLCSACNRPACLKREFGVGGSEELELTLNGLTKINTEPPTWYINIDGVRCEMEDIDVLINQRSFRTLVAQSINKLFAYIKVPAWERTVQELLEHVEVVDAPEDSSFGGQLGEEIREFLQTYAQEDGLEQVLAHTVYVDRVQGRAFFKSSDLIRRLKKNLGQMASPQKAWAYLKHNIKYDVLNQEHPFQDIGPVRLWSISIRNVHVPQQGLSAPLKALEASDDVPF